MGSEHHLFKFKIEAQSSSPCFGNNTAWSPSIGPFNCQSYYSTVTHPFHGTTSAVSFSLVLPDGSRGVPLDARFKFSLLDRDGRPVPSRIQASSFRNWSTCERWLWSCSNFVTSEDLRRPEYHDGDGCFTVRCDVALRRAARVASTAGDTEVPPPSDLHQHLGRLLTEEEGADVTFQVAGGETFAAHRCVLAARSPVFRAQLFGHMKESKQSTGMDMPIPIDDMEAQVFRSLLRFIYTDSLLETDDGGSDDDDWVVVQHQHLLAAADRFGLERMKLVCEDKLRKRIRASCVATMLVSAERHHCRGLKEACFDFLSSGTNLESFTETDGFDLLLTTCPAVLKELLARLATTLIFE